MLRSRCPRPTCDLYGEGRARVGRGLPSNRDRPVGRKIPVRWNIADIESRKFTPIVLMSGWEELGEHPYGFHLLKVLLEAWLSPLDPPIPPTRRMRGRSR